MTGTGTQADPLVKMDTKWRFGFTQGLRMTASTGSLSYTFAFSVSNKAIMGANIASMETFRIYELEEHTISELEGN